MGNSNQKVIFKMATPEEQAIQGVIDQIWETYDVDKSGELDKEETKKFVQDTLGNLGSEMSSLMRLSMRSSLPSTRTALVPSRSQRWLFSSSNFSVATEQHEHQGG